MHVDDQEFVERARRGEAGAFGELVRQYQDQAVAAAYVILGDRHEAEDAAQEAFTRAFVALQRFRPGAPFRPWLLTIVVNEARDLRSARRRRTEAISRTADGLDTIPATESAEAAALNESRREALLGSLFDLAEVDRMVVTCRYFLDLSEAEIADILGVARGTVKSRLARAVARLGPVLRELGPLVVVPPSADLAHAIPQTGGVAGTRLGSNIRQVATFAGAGVAALVIGSLVLVNRGATTAPPVPVPVPAPAAATTPAAAKSMLVLGGDLTDSQRQELTQDLAAPGATTATVSDQELADALSAQGVSLQPSDAALSSVQIVCGSPSSGLHVATQNISRLAPAEYASALLTAGMYDGSVVVAAPRETTASGETALVGLFKAYPTCAGDSQPDQRRVRLAYQQLSVIDELASSDDKLPDASAAVLDVLNAIATGQAADPAAVQRAIDSAAVAHGLSLEDGPRNRAVSYFQQLVGLDFGTDAHGFTVQQTGAHDVRVAPRQ